MAMLSGELSNTCRVRYSARLRSVMSLLVSKIAVGFPSASRCNAHRLATVTCAVALRVYELSFPAARPEQLRIDLFEPCGKDRLRELVSDLADSLLTLPSVEFFRATVPEGDDVIHVAHEDRVVREVEEFGALAQRLFCALLVLPSAQRAHSVSDLVRQIAAEPCYGASQVRCQIRISFDFAPVESVGIKGKRATQIEKTLRSRISDQGKCNTGKISQRRSLGSPMRKSRVRADIIDPTEPCCPDGIADRSSSRVRIAPGDLDAVQD